MTDYRYKVTLTHEDCLSKRIVAFHSPSYLDWWGAGKEAVHQLSSQTCIRCNLNHPNREYVVTDIQRGEPGNFGQMFWRDVYPPYKKDTQLEMSV